MHIRSLHTFMVKLLMSILEDSFVSIHLLTYLRQEFFIIESRKVFCCTTDECLCPSFKSYVDCEVDTW